MSRGNDKRGADRLRGKFGRPDAGRKSSRSRRARSSSPDGTETSASLTHKVLFEPLEKRLLFSADLMPFVVDMGSVGDDLTLKLNSTAATIEVYSTVNPAAGPLVSQKLDQTSQIIVRGTDNHDDRLTVDFTAPFF